MSVTKKKDQNSGVFLLQLLVLLTVVAFSIFFKLSFTKCSSTEAAAGDSSSCVQGEEPDSCNPNPCHHGRCRLNDDNVDDFECICDSGWEGDLCDTDTDNCSPNPCQHGGTCTDLLNDYSCSCPIGYNGRNCEIDVDNCRGGACPNGGTCLDGQGTYECKCAEGWEGPICDTSVDDCRAPSNPCHNGGTCIDQHQGYRCTCPPGYEGLTCETDTDDCSYGVCMNGGTCIDGDNTFTCKCAPGWGGWNCNSKEAIPGGLDVVFAICRAGATVDNNEFKDFKNAAKKYITEFQARVAHTDTDDSDPGDFRAGVISWSGGNYNGGDAVVNEIPLTANTEYIVGVELPRMGQSWSSVATKSLAPPLLECINQLTVTGDDRGPTDPYRLCVIIADEKRNTDSGFVTDSAVLKYCQDKMSGQSSCTVNNIAKNMKDRHGINVLSLFPCPYPRRTYDDLCEPDYMKDISTCGSSESKCPFFRKLNSSGQLVTQAAGHAVELSGIINAANTARPPQRRARLLSEPGASSGQQGEDEEAPLESLSPCDNLAAAEASTECCLDPLLSFIPLLLLLPLLLYLLGAVLPVLKDRLPNKKIVEEPKKELVRIDEDKTQQQPKPSEEAGRKKKYKWDIKYSENYMWPSAEGGKMPVDYGRTLPPPPSAPQDDVRKKKTSIRISSRLVNEDAPSSSSSADTTTSKKGRWRCVVC